ncbi:PAS domain S-box protein [Fictibacillus aquaticus]|uniref:histidine kinase n=1 Tax=Fictibacillus aquaticus TaxID=2021314 RepID=A0A235F8T8_9BACL|nr:PAS domain S-box protein [Fictibacillus aquaticus]OYD57423.1 hypothetical protein CGZ90_12150 [Fictibacillus aquaticus]
MKESYSPPQLADSKETLHPYKAGGISKQKSMTFTFKKENGEMIMTESEGPLFDAFGLTREQVIGKSVKDIFPSEIAQFKLQCYERAWQGESVTYESVLNGIPFLAAIGPVYRDNEVVEVYGFCVDTTERVVMERQLAESEQRFHSLIEHNMDALFSVDLSGRFTTVNPACECLTGFTQNELLGMTFHPLLPENRHAYAEQQFKEAINGTPQTHEISVLVKSGERRFVNLTLTPIIVMDQVLGVYGIAKDITEKKNYERELRDTKELLEAVIYNSTDAISIINFADNTTQVNPAFEEIYGWSTEELSYFPAEILPIVPEDMRKESEQLLSIVKKGGYVKSHETTRLHKTGRRITVSLSLSPVFGDKGDVIAMSAMSRDITESKEKEKALRASEEKYRIIAENTMDLIAVAEPAGKITYVSPSIRQLLGFDSSHYIGRNGLMLFNSEDIAKAKIAFRTMAATKLPVKFEARGKHANGGFVLLESQATPVVNEENNELESVVVVSRDLTERKKTEEMLRKSDKLSVLGQLAAGVAHEIRNPLTSIKGFLQLLQSRAKENNEYYSIMLSEIDRINGIVGEFMLLAKPQAMNFTLTDIKQLINHVISLLDSQAILLNVQIYFDYDKDLPSVWCVENQIKQVFINILKNAIESMPNGGTVRVRIYVKDGFIWTSITDEGCGIEDDRIKTLGEPFYTTKEKGTGLGLMICYKIVENHNGKISIDSKVGEGSTFTIALPLTDEMPAAD